MELIIEEKRQHGECTRWNCTCAMLLVLAEAMVFEL